MSQNDICISFHFHRYRYTGKKIIQLLNGENHICLDCLHIEQFFFQFNDFQILEFLQLQIRAVAKLYSQCSMDDQNQVLILLVCQRKSLGDLKTKTRQMWKKVNVSVFYQK